MFCWYGNECLKLGHTLRIEARKQKHRVGHDWRTTRRDAWPPPPTAFPGHFHLPHTLLLTFVEYDNGRIDARNVELTARQWGPSGASIVVSSGSLPKSRPWVYLTVLGVEVIESTPDRVRRGG